jgi:hypothetical protein
MPERPLIPHLTLPIRLSGGALAAAQQDEIDDIASAVETVTRYQPGGLDYDADFGVTDQAFQQGGADPEVLNAAIERFEPRAIKLVTEDPDRFTEIVERVGVDRLRVDLTKTTPEG